MSSQNKKLNKMKMREAKLKEKIKEIEAKENFLNELRKHIGGFDFDDSDCFDDSDDKKRMRKIIQNMVDRANQFYEMENDNCMMYLYNTWAPPEMGPMDVTKIEDKEYNIDHRVSIYKNGNDYIRSTFRYGKHDYEGVINGVCYDNNDV